MATHTEQQGAHPVSRAKTIFKQVAVTALVLGIAGGGGASLLATAKKPERSKPAPYVPSVEVMPLTPSTETVYVEGYGTVKAARQVTVRPQVGGIVAEKGKQLRPGGHVAAGELLFRIDDRDHRLAVQRAEAAVEKARAALEIEQGQQAIARAEWELVSDKLRRDEARRRLALRQPQLREAKAGLAQAESELESARLNLERTRITAPFDAVVVTDNVEAGELLTVGEAAVTLVATDTFWVEVMLGADELARLTRAYRSGPVEGRVFRPDAALPARTGRLVSVLADLADGSRLGRALVAVDDPLQLERDAAGEPMRVGTFVHVRLPAGQLEGVYVVPREALRENNRIWVRNAEGKLAFRPVEPVANQGERVLLSAAIEAGDQVITSRLGRPVPGMSLKVADGERS